MTKARTILESTDTGDISLTTTPVFSQMHVHNSHNKGYTHFNHNNTAKNYIRGAHTYVDTDTTFGASVNFNKDVKFAKNVTVDVDGINVKAWFGGAGTRFAALERRMNDAESRLKTGETTLNTELSCPPIQRGHHEGYDVMSYRAPNNKACQKSCPGTHFAFRHNDNHCWCQAFPMTNPPRKGWNPNDPHTSGPTCTLGRQ